MSTRYAGRSRQSIADIEEHLNEIIFNHPNSHLNDNGEPVIPADALVDVFRAFSESYDGVELMTNDEMDLLKMLLASNPGLEVTPQTLLGFIAEKTKHSPRESPKGSPQGGEVELPERGRSVEREAGDRNSRSSSRDSTGTSRGKSRTPSLGPPVPPKTPNSSSPFDASQRQRSTPLGAPSSWTKRPAPAHRRKSINGSQGRALSDSESSSPSSFGRTPSRTRAPSNPTTPASSIYSSNSSFGSPPLGGSVSRPHSRTQSHPMPPGNLNYQYGSPDHDILSKLPDPFDMSKSMYDSVSSLPMPRAGSDSDSDNEVHDSDDADSSLGLVLDRSAASSTVSLEPHDRLEALQRANADLGRKLMDAERTLQNKLSDHESELEEMQGRLEEARSELSATKREEKELRSKERQNSTQISALESEIAKLQKSLDNARASYQSLQKQYQEQCSESERYRNTLRRRDQEIKDFQDAAALQALENHKYAKEHDTYEERIAFLESELSIAQQAHAQLDEQKQENLMLKETIDRMRFDMDEMRNNAASTATGGGGSSGQSSRSNTMSKSLGAELLGKMTGAHWEKMRGNQWGIADGEGHGEGEEEGESGETVVNLDSDGEETEGEDVVQTIITRKKRKVPGRANKIETVQYHETKEYSDAYTQHESAEFTASAQIQTDLEPKILTASFSTQTDEPLVQTLAIQTDPEPLPPPKVTIDTEIQTEEVAVETSRSPSPNETMASSSSTLVPPTPKPAIASLHPDLPPAYNQVTEQDQDEQKWRVATETLKHWHKGVNIPFEPVPGGVSEDAVEHWKSLQDELGIGCMVVDEVIATSEKTGQPRSTKDGKRRSKFYNIYNTYVYGHGKDGPSSFPTSFASQIALCMGASAFVVLALGPYVIPHYAIPGGPTYYDRSAWHAFNSMQATGEGFSPDSATAVWSFIGRVGDGAARIARGWPT